MGEATCTTPVMRRPGGGVGRLRDAPCRARPAKSSPACQWRGAGAGWRRQRDEEMREGAIQPNTEGKGSKSWEKGQRCAQYRSILEDISNVNS
jgi:hypothetical protein